MKNFNFRGWLVSLLLLVVVLLTNKSYAQLTGTKNIPGDYADLATAITDLNTQGVGAGGVTFNLLAGNPQTAPAGGYVIGGAGSLVLTTASVANPITFTGNANTITANGTLVAGNLNDAIFKIIGGDFITIQGFSLNENIANTTITPASNNMTEFGIALFYETITNGCQNISILNNTISLGATYQNAFGVYANSTHSATSMTTSATATGATGGNNNLSVKGNTISNVHMGVIVVGPTASADHNNTLTIGGTTLAEGNTITFGSSSLTGISGYVNLSLTNISGVLVRNTVNTTVSNNSLASNGTVQVGTLNGVFFQAFSNAPIGTFTQNVNNNQISLRINLIAGIMNGISLAGTSASATSTVNILNNNFFNFDHVTPTATGAVTFINQSGTHFTQNYSNNTFTNMTLKTTGSVTFLSHSNTIPVNGTQTVNNNSIVTQFTKTGAGGTVTFSTTGASSPNTANGVYTNNNFSNITVSGATAVVGFSNNDGSGSAASKNYSNNIISNITGGTSAISGITINYLGGGLAVISNNTFSNITSQGSITGITLGNTFAGSALIQASNNSIFNLNSNGTGGTIVGITSTNTGANLLIESNTIHSFNTTAVSVFGISGAALNRISRNKVYNLTSTNTGAAVSGISISSGSNPVIVNNVIGDLKAPNANVVNAIMGISVNGGSATAPGVTVAYNTVYLDATSVGATFGTSALFTTTTPVLTLNNNLLINNSTPNGATGISVAYRRSSTTLTTYNAASNKNAFFAGAPSANNLLFYDGTTGDQNMVAYLTRLATASIAADANSFSENQPYGTTFFTSLTGSSADYLKPTNGTVTQAESGATNIPGITVDYANVTRAGNGGYTGTGTNPDCGAFEFEGSTPAPQITISSISPSGNQCTNVARVVTANITTASGTITSASLAYAINGTAQAPITMTNSSGSTWTATIPTVVPTNAVVTWAISATNSLGLSSTTSIQTYSDEPLTGYLASASSDLNNVCAGSTVNLFTQLTAPLNPTYSTPSIVNPTTDEDLRTVRITQGATVLLNNSSTLNTLTGTLGTATGTVGSYSNWTALDTVNLVANQSYNLFVASIDAPGFFTNFGSAFIDFNRDGDFADAGETLIPSTGQLANAAVDNGNDSIQVAFTVPATALNGFTRLRVAVTETGQTNPAGLLNNTYGEFEDYLVFISGSNTPITSVTWLNGATTVGTANPLVVNPTTTTTYTANITAFGCTVSPAPTVTVNVNPVPTAPTASNSSQCGAAIPTASVSSTSGMPTPTFNWYTAAVGGSPVQSSTSTTFTSTVSSTTTFHVSEINLTTGCEGPRTAVTINVSSADPIDATASATSICIGSTVNLNVTNTAGTPTQSYTYTWQALTNSGITAPTTGATQNNVMPTVPGTYKYAVSAIDGSCSAVDSVTVVVNPFTATVTPINATCFGSNNGSFSVASTTCGTAAQYSVDGGAFSATIPTNLTAGAHTVIVQNTLGYQSSVINFTVTQPSQVVSANVVGATVCQGVTSAQIIAGPTTGTISSSFGTNVAVGSSATVNLSTTPSLPANAVVTSTILRFSNVSTFSAEWPSDMNVSLTGGSTLASISMAPVNSVVTNAGPYDRTASNYTSGPVNLQIVNTYTGTATLGSVTLEINYTIATPPSTNFYDAATGGTLLGTGLPFQTVGTSVLPNTNTPGTYTFYAEGVNGTCVSPTRTAVTVTVNALPTVNGGANVAVCQGQQATLTATGTATSYVWSPVVTNGVAFTPAATGNYIVTGTGSNGCTNKDTVLVTVNALPIVSAGLDQTVCAGSSVTLNGSGAVSYTWNNGVTNATPFTATTTTTYTVTGTDANNCQNTDQVVVNVNNATSSSVSATACVTYTWAQNGMTYTTSGAYTDTVPNAVGCDSIITLNLVINQPTSSSVSETACSSFTWAQNGMTYTASGAYTDTIPNAVGCDSIITLNLVINQPTSSSVSETACTSYTWAQNGMTYTASGAYTDTIPNASGCDSIITLNLVINQPTSSSVSETACGSFTWSQNGTTYTVSGAYTDTIPNAAGCDSIITLNLTINNGGTSTETASACGTYTWAQNGQTYTASGAYDHVIVGGSANGCDSIITLNLTINAFPTATATYSGDSILTSSAGTTYQWIDCATNTAIAGATAQTFQATANGSYAVVVTNAAGCSDTSACVTVNDLGLDGKEFTFINVYPNPTTSNVIVEMNVDNATIELVDAQGKIISVSTINNGGTIDLTNAERGVYFLRVRSENGETTKRIVKQ